MKERNRNTKKKQNNKDKKRAGETQGKISERKE